MMNFTMWWRRGKNLLEKEDQDLINKAWQQKCAELEHTLKRSQERYLCLHNVMERHKRPMVYEFKITSKGIPVVLCMDMESCTIELYNLNNNPDAQLMLKLSALQIGREASIVHVAGGVRLGHGQLAVEYFLEYCKLYHIKRVTTKFTAKDRETEKELVGFFSKCGFTVLNQVGVVWEMAYRVVLDVGF